MPSVNVSWGVRDESALPHMLILSEKQLHRVLHASVTYFNEARPHQGIHQQVPQGEVTSVPPDQRSDRLISVPVLGGLHHEYRRVAWILLRLYRNTRIEDTPGITVFVTYSKGPSSLSSPTEGEDEQCLLLHGGWRDSRNALVSLHV